MIAAAHATAEVAGYRDFWRAAPPALAGRLGIARRDVAGGVCLACAAMGGSPIFNHAVGLGVSARAGEAELEEVDAFYAGLGVGYLVAVDAAAEGLAEALSERGFRDGSRPWMTFGREPESSAVTA